MILVRDVFQLKFGKAREAIALWKTGQKYLKKAGAKSIRLCTDLTGPYYTLVLESTYQSLTEYEQRMSAAMNDDWRAWYQEFVQLVDSGHREMYTIV